MRRLLLASVLLSAPAYAAERTVGVGSFDRVRIDGAFDVRIATGRSPRATLSGESDAIERVDLRVDGTTLHLRRRSGDAGARGPSAPVTVTLAAQTLVSAFMLGGGRLAVTAMRGPRVELQVAGAGVIAVERVEAEQASAAMIGGGRITLAGRATRLRLSTDGPGAIDAANVVADDLTVRLDGPGETLAQARYAASISNSGFGRVVVTGKARCTVRAPAGGTVECGE